MSLFQSKQNIFSTSSSHQMNTNPSLDSIKKAEEYTKSKTGKSPKDNEITQELIFLKKTRKSKTKCFKCDYEDCNFASYSEKELSLHLQLHNDALLLFQCPPCNLKFLKEENFIKHKQSHLKDSKKLVQCEFPGCNKKYTTIYNRDIHFRKHTGETPFICNICGRSYYERANYKYHLRTGHISIPVSEKMCQHPKCQQSFKSLKTKLLHHSKFEPECERDKGILIDLLAKFKSTVEDYMSKFNIDEESLEGVDEFKFLKKQFEETSCVIMNKEQLFTAAGDKINFV